MKTWLKRIQESCLTSHSSRAWLPPWLLSVAPGSVAVGMFDSTLWTFCRTGLLENLLQTPQNFVADLCACWRTVQGVIKGGRERQWASESASRSVDAECDACGVYYPAHTQQEKRKRQGPFVRAWGKEQEAVGRLPWKRGSLWISVHVGRMLLSPARDAWGAILKTDLVCARFVDPVIFQNSQKSWQEPCR